MISCDLRASAVTGTVDTVGWGVSAQGRAHTPGSLQRNSATFSLTDGEDIGGLVNDEPADVSYNPRTGRLEPIPTLARVAGYQQLVEPNAVLGAFLGPG